jgi:hypothetical protein
MCIPQTNSAYKVGKKCDLPIYEMVIFVFAERKYRILQIANNWHVLTQKLGDSSQKIIIILFSGFFAPVGMICQGSCLECMS